MTGRPVVLVIDDSAEVRTVVSAVLATKGFDTVEAGDPATAVEALKGAHYALIMLDMKMPHDGKAMLDFIGETYPELLPRVILFVPLIEPKVRAVLSKPLDIEELAGVIGTCASA
jgi:CheY-like chemotaxis protein